MSYKPDSNVTVIVIHYSATAIESDITIEAIDGMHRNRGFRKIGYHWYIRKSGEVFAGRDLSQAGRFEVGAQSKGENTTSIGICFEGGVTKAKPNVGFDSRTPAQTKSMIRLIDEMQERFQGAIVKGHRDMPGAATQCPGFNAAEWWDSVVKERNKPKGIAALIAAILSIFGVNR
jgi:N-acetylmuramoyl-L-alanine amidase